MSYSGVLGAVAYLLEEVCESLGFAGLYADALVYMHDLYHGIMRMSIRISRYSRGVSR